jgi:nucleoside-diphosphate-sugar epimerase
MTILVTGSAGHLGEALMQTLRRDKRACRGLDLKPSDFTDCVGSIIDRDFVRRSLAGAGAVIHAATLHKPHIGTHSEQEFIDTNIAGTLILLEEAVNAGVRAFVYTSTTSAFGLALKPKDDDPALWITEDIVPVPKNIYGVTKLAAEHLCEMFARKGRLPIVVLRAARFFPEIDDDPDLRDRYQPLNAQANELLFRRADLADVVDAHLLALAEAGRLQFDRFIISATTPFEVSDLPQLRFNAAEVVSACFPDAPRLFAARGWVMFAAIDRVYVNRRARERLGWTPKYDFRHVLDCLRADRDFRSPLAREVGQKLYHDRVFEEGPYPLARD